MKGFFTALCLPLLLGAAGAANATTVTFDFNTPANTTPNALLITNGPMSKPAMSTIMVNGKSVNVVQTGGTSDNEFLYVGLPKAAFKSSKAVWAQVEYYDQGTTDPTTTSSFQVHYDVNGTDTTVNQAATAQHDTKTLLTHTWTLPGADFEEMGPGGADLWIDDTASGPVAVDKIIVTDEDPTVTHWPHVGTVPVKIDGVISPGEWDNAYHAPTVNSAAQDALHGADWTGPSDFSGDYYFQWDENGVYVRGDVTDATPRLNDAGAPTYGPPAYWDGDGFQLYLGLDWSDPTHTSYLPTDYNIYVGLGDGKNGSLPPSWAVELNGGSPIVDWSMLGTQPIPAANLAINNTTKPVGYQFEFFMPWQMLLSASMDTTTKITPGQKIGWFIFANNSKEVGPSNQDVAMSPFAASHPSSNPSAWTTVVLDAAPTQPVTNPPGGTTTGTTTGGTTTAGTTTGTTTGGTTTGTTTGGTTTGTTTGGTTGGTTTGQ